MSPRRRSADIGYLTGPGCLGSADIGYLAGQKSVGLGIRSGENGREKDGSGKHGRARKNGRRGAGG